MSMRSDCMGLDLYLIFFPEGITILEKIESSAILYLDRAARYLEIMLYRGGAVDAANESVAAVADGPPNALVAVPLLRRRLTPDVATFLPTLKLCHCLTHGATSLL